MRTVLLVGVALILTGCASRAERAAQLAAAQKQSAAAQKQLAAAQDAQCKSYGLTPGTDSYAQCRMMLYQTEEQRRAASARAASDASDASDAVLRAYLQMRQQNYQQQMQMQQQNYQQQMQTLQSINRPKPTLNCTTSYIGTQAYTTCQ